MKFSSLYAIAFGAALLASCSGEKTASLFGPIDYTLTVTNLEDADSTYLYLYDYDLLPGWKEFPAEALIDSALIAGNQAEFAVKGSKAPVVVLRVNGKNDVVIPQAGKNTYDAATLTGSGTVAQIMKNYNDSLRAIYTAAYANMPAQDDPVYEAYIDSVDALLLQLNQDALSDNLDNAFGYYQFTTYSDLTLAQVDTIIALQPEFAKSKRIQLLVDDCKRLEATSAGHPYVDFEVEYNGETVKLSDYVKPGEYTLVDFWASWCGPCKRAIAALKEDYDTLRAEGLNIVGVAVWEDPEATEGWLLENPLPWQLILNAQTIPTDLYSIKGIPTMLLIGPDGTILVRSYSDEEVLDTFHSAIAGQ